MTRQKQLIYHIVTSSPEHMTAEEIYDRARRHMPTLARGTVYRNLGLLTGEGRIGKLELPDSPARYDRVSLPHPHLICQRCGGVEDLPLPAEDIAALVAPLEKNITGYDLRFFHICPACKSFQEESS